MNNIEAFIIEINLRKCKWLLSCSYNPNKNLISNHLKELGKQLDTITTKYEKVLILGDFNATPENQTVKDFCHVHNLDHLINEPTCYKNPNNPSCIDLMITNTLTVLRICALLIQACLIFII